MNRDSEANITLSVDVVGGDYGYSVAVVAALSYAASNKNVSFILHGDSTEIESCLSESDIQISSDRIKIVDAKKFVTSSDKPATTIRKAVNTSMWNAISAVKKKEADAVISAGNTGALMVLARYLLGMLEGIDRPALAALVPGGNKDIVFLDMGANTSCNAENLLQFGVMGALFINCLLSIEKPTIGLLNVGVEEIKGSDVVKYAHKLFQESEGDFSYLGYVEGSEIFMRDDVDVFVTDGFTGNLMLKSVEGFSHVMMQNLKEIFSANLLSKIGYKLNRKQLKAMFSRFTASKYNGAMMLGLNGICIKSHGNAKKESFINALDVAYRLSSAKINDKIQLGANK